MIAQGFLLVLVGAWLLLQTLVGNLPARILSWRNAKVSNKAPVGNSVPTPDLESIA